MKSVKVLIKDSEGKIEREAFINDLEEMYPLESWDEADVDEALDILTENMPWFFASEKDGKLYGYEFEIVVNDDGCDEKNSQKDDSSKYRLKNWLIDRQLGFYKNAFFYDESQLSEMKADLEKRDLEDVMCCYDVCVGSLEDALFEYGQERFYEKCVD